MDLRIAKLCFIHVTNMVPGVERQGLAKDTSLLSDLLVLYLFVNSIRHDCSGYFVCISFLT